MRGNRGNRHTGQQNAYKRGIFLVFSLLPKQNVKCKSPAHNWRHGKDPAQDLSYPCPLVPTCLPSSSCPLVPTCLPSSSCLRRCRRRCSQHHTICLRKVFKLANRTRILRFRTHKTGQPGGAACGIKRAASGTGEYYLPMEAHVRMSGVRVWGSLSRQDEGGSGCGAVSAGRMRGAKSGQHCRFLSYPGEMARQKRKC